MADEKKVQTENDIPTSYEELRAYNQDEMRRKTEEMKKEHEANLPSDEEMEKKVIEELKTIYDPEIPVNIYDLGLIYNVHCWTDDLTKLKRCKIKMTLTSATCSMSEIIVDMVRSIANRLDYLEEVDVDLVFDPPWDQNQMSDEAKLQLGLL